LSEFELTAPPLSAKPEKGGNIPLNKKTTAQGLWSPNLSGANALAAGRIYFLVSTQVNSSSPSRDFLLK
jgi:hypothetical protein